MKNKILFKFILAFTILTSTIVVNLSTTNAIEHNHYHDYVYVAQVDPTCLNDGMLEHYRCSKCDKLFIKSSNTHFYYEVSAEYLTIDKLHCNLVHVESTNPTCTTNGNIEYWYCSACDFYFSDLEGMNQIALEDTIIESTGHNLTHVESTNPTCTTDGNIEYWYCSACDFYFSDLEGMNQIALEDTIIESTGHNLTHVESTNPTCTTDGNIEYWYCSTCDLYFSDLEDMNQISFEDTVIKTTGHNLTHVVSTNPTCTTDGNIEYWYCSTCDLYFSDLEGMNQISFEDTVIKTTGHNLTHVESTNPTCTTDGNIEYWYCSACDLYFSDLEGMNLIALEDTVIKTTGHNLIKIEAKNPTTDEYGNIEYYICNECNKYFILDIGFYEVNFTDVIIDKLLSTQEPETNNNEDVSKDNSVNTSDSTSYMIYSSLFISSLTYMIHQIKLKLLK